MFKSVNGGILPKRFTKYSCGFDVFANEDKVIGAGCTELIGLGIAIDLEQIKGRFIGAYLSDNGADEYFDEHAFTEFKERHYFELHIRSSLRVKGLTSLGTGIIDIDFVPKCKIGKAMNNQCDCSQCANWEDCEIKMVVHFPKPKENWIEAYTINKGDKIGQLILKRHEGYLIPQEYTLDTERSGGFGITGQ